MFKILGSITILVFCVEIVKNLEDCCRCLQDRINLCYDIVSLYREVVLSVDFNFVYVVVNFYFFIVSRYGYVC